LGLAWCAVETRRAGVVRLSEAGLQEGVERHEVDGVPIRVTGVARTVADCFKFRNKIGLDVALEALRDARRSRKATSGRAMSLREDRPRRERDASLSGGGRLTSRGDSVRARLREVAKQRNEYFNLTQNVNAVERYVC